MKKKYQELFIEENYLEAEKTYLESLHGTSGALWDYVAITASSEKQARGYRAQLEYRLAHGMLPDKTEYLVVADPEGKRVGSGGACLNVLYEIAKRESAKKRGEKALFEGLRILCIHSGGDSRRVPQYSVCGKLFAPMPRRMGNGLSSTLFDEIMLTVSAFPSMMADGMLTCSGDVLLFFDPQKMEYFSGGAAAVSIKTDVSIGCNHGVYLSDGCGRVRKFLHKQTVDTLKASGAVDENGQVDIDTGAVLFDSEILRRLYSLVDSEEKLRHAVNDRVRLSFYADFSYPTSVEATLEDYLCEKPEGVFTPELLKYRGELWKLLSDCNMKLTVFSPARFLHFGTTAELRALMTEELPSFWKRSSWDRFINTDLFFRESAEENVTVNGGVIADNAVIRRGSYIEDSYVGSWAQIGEGCVISCSRIPEGAVIPPDTVVSTVKTADGYVARVYSVYDDPKERKHFGKSIIEPLWSSNMFPVLPTAEAAVAASLALYCGGEGTYSGRLVSLESSFFDAYGDGISEYREQMIADNMKRSFLSIAERKASFYRIEGVFEELDEALKKRIISEFIDLTKALEEREDKKWLSARLNAYLYGLTSKGEYLDAVFDCFSEAMLLGDSAPLYGAKPVCDEKSVSLPVRVNFAGGWTDTPPFCIENGGTVLNAAVILGDKLPITATARVIPERKLVFISDEERVEVYADTVAELFAKCQPVEPFAIHKAALITCGLLKEHCDGSTLFDALEGGLELSTSVRGIPKGSGLGTSSILSGALVSALYGLFGVEPEGCEIWQKVLMMEQYMGVGGGWQDQVGGMIAGIKLIRSEAGMNQNPVVDQLNISDATKQELDERFALIYTGQRREAKKILRVVMWLYSIGDERVKSTLFGLKELATDMAERLENGDVDGFAELLTESCRRTERLYHACSNLCIEEIFEAVDDLICGRMICGAGGGGYLQVVLKKGVTLDQLQNRLTEVFGECDITAQKCRFI